MGPRVEIINHAMKHTLIAHIYRVLKRFSSWSSRVHVPGDEFRLAHLNNFTVITRQTRSTLLPPCFIIALHENRAFYPTVPVRFPYEPYFPTRRIIQFRRVNGRRTGSTTTGHRLHPAGSSENSIDINVQPSFPLPGSGPCRCSQPAILNGNATQVFAPQQGENRSHDIFRVFSLLFERTAKCHLRKNWCRFDNKSIRKVFFFNLRGIFFISKSARFIFAPLEK